MGEGRPDAARGRLICFHSAVMSASPPSPPSSSTQVEERPVSREARLPRLEDFPEAGPNALATIQQRGAARIIDELLLILPVFFVIELPMVAVAGLFAVQLVYEIVAVAIWGQTLGKYAVGIRVARYTDGQRPTWTQSSLRCLLWAAPGALTLIWLQFSAVGALAVFLTAYRDPLRRALHDESGGTIVVRTR
jgi:uncharacterized RDD family membrane protein YckC